MCFSMLASQPRHAMGLEGLKHGDKIYIFVWEQVELGVWMVNTLCHMIFQCQTRLASSVTMLINHVFFYVGFSTKACHGFGRRQTWGQNIYVCVGASLIGCLDGKHTLPHDFSVARHV